MLLYMMIATTSAMGTGGLHWGSLEGGQEELLDDPSSSERENRFSLMQVVRTEDIPSYVSLGTVATADQERKGRKSKHIVFNDYL